MTQNLMRRSQSAKTETEAIPESRPHRPNRSGAIHHTALRFRRLNQTIQIGGISVRTGDIIHANAEGVIKIPKASLSNLAETAIRMRAYEHANHIVLRRSDLSLAEKQKRISAVDVKYGFA